MAWRGDIGAEIERELGSLRGLHAAVGKPRVYGLDAALQNIQELGDGIISQCDIRTKKVANKVLLESKKIVPYRSGDLFRSGVVNPMPAFAMRKRPTWYMVSYGGPSADYAAAVHDNVHDLDVASFNKPGVPRPYPGYMKQPYFLTVAAMKVTKEFVAEVKQGIELEVLETGARASMTPTPSGLGMGKVTLRKKV